MIGYSFYNEISECALQLYTAFLGMTYLPEEE